MTGENNPMWNKSASDETKLKQSIASKKHWADSAFATKMSTLRIGLQAGENHPMYGKHHTPKTREKMRISHMGKNNHMYGKSHTPETKKKMIIAQQRIHSDPDFLSKQSIAHTGKSPSLKTRAKLSMAFSGENNPMYGRPSPHGKRNAVVTQRGAQIRMIGSYEPLVAFALSASDIVWSYEPKAFPLVLDGKRVTYRPDFYLPEYNMWLEVKGFWRGDAYQKVSQFYIQYPNENLRILYENDIDKIICAILSDDDITPIVLNGSTLHDD
jgi:hypothetical protein